MSSREHTEQNYNPGLLAKVVGKVVRGNGDGKRLGFPTANIELSSAMFLGNDFTQSDFGVYFCKVAISTSPQAVTQQSPSLPAALHYGARLVYGESAPQWEVHILDFSEDIYDQFLYTEVIQKVRNSQNFSSETELVKQMKKDIAKIRELAK
ncbi:MAG: riboflavin kinase [Candidatus Dojkabacteria bacterium]